MDSQEQPMEKPMTDAATTSGGESQLVVDQLAVSLMCWHMRRSMLVFQTLQKQQLMIAPLLSAKCMIYFPSNLINYYYDEYEENE